MPYSCTMGDLYGVHRVDNTKATSSIVGEARQRTIEMQEAALKGILARSRSLVDGKSQQDFLSNPEEIDRGRSLIGRSKVAASLKRRGEGANLLSTAYRRWSIPWRSADCRKTPMSLKLNQRR